MEITTAFSYAMFLLACFFLAWSVFMTFAKATIFVGYAIGKQSTRVTFTPELWVGCISFTVIMGYIFIM